jgi:inorganic pyrophosphatase
MIKAIIEMPAGTRYKYEISKVSGNMEIDRPLNVSVPTNYGFIVDTLAKDGDALDVFIISSEPIPPLTMVKLDIICGYSCEDNGVLDEKIIAKLHGDSLSQLDVHSTEVNIVNYLSVYKYGFKLGERLTKEQAEALVEVYKI